jgi:hypothetical protein
MVAYYGRRQTTDYDAGLTSAGNVSNQRFSVFEPMPVDGWAHTLYGLVGKKLGDPNVTMRFGLADTQDSNPNELMAWSGTQTISSAMSSGADGTLITAAIANSDPDFGFISTAVMMWSGRRYAAGFSATSGQLYHGMIAAAHPENDYTNNNLYRKNNGSVTPTGSPLYTTATNEGVMTVAVGYDPNVQPDVPINRSPSGTIQTTTPTFNSDFNDDNEVYGDGLKQYQIQLRQVGSSALKWDDTINASGAEQAARITTTEYGGSAMVAGTSYEWRIRHRDRFNWWGSWSSWLTITPASAGFMGQGSSPVGKQLVQNPGPFVLPWSHGSGLSTNAVQIRLVSGSTVLQTSPIITKTVANGANASITWAETGFSNLAYGSNVAYEARGRDTNNLWSSYGPNRSISINAKPNKPSLVSPKNSVVLTARPMLIGKVTDPDNTAPLSLVEARIKNAAGAVLFTRTMALKAGSLDTYQYQTTAVDLASFASYQWDMRGGDGSLTGAWSDVGLFTYATGPSVVITAPTADQILATSTPTFAWTAATQISASIDIFNAVTGVYVIGAIVDSVTKTWVVPAGYLKNGGSYTFRVHVIDNTGLSGVDQEDFTLVYTVPTAVAGFAGSTIPLGNDDKPSTVHLTWTADVDPTFQWYTVKRRDQGTEAGDPSEIILRFLTSQSQVAFYDTTPASGHGYTYALTRTILTGTDYLESAEAIVDLMVEFDSIILSSVRDGLTYRVALTYQESGKITHRDDKELFMPWGEAEPYIQMSPVDYQEVAATFRVVNDRRGNARDVMEAFRALKTHQRQTASTICYRDGRGRRIFGYLTLGENDQRLNQYGAEVGFIQTNYQEGEETS